MSIPASPEPFRLDLYRRRWTAWFTLPFGVVMGLCSVGSLIFMHALPGALGVAVAVGGFLTCLAVALAVVGRSLRALRDRSPVLSFDAEGISYFDDGLEFFSWSSIERISTNESEGHHMGLWFTTGPAGASLGRSVRRAVVGADKLIYLGNLVYSPRALDAAIARLRRAAGTAAMAGAASS